MKTIFSQTTPDELALLKKGKNFFLFYSKIAPQAGQPLILQTPDEEYSTKIEFVQSAPGLIKHWHIIAWDIEPVIINNVAPVLSGEVEAN